MLELLHDMNPAEMRYQRGSFSSIQGIAAMASSTPTVKDKDKCKLQLKFVLYTRAIFSDVLQAKNTRKGKKKKHCFRQAFKKKEMAKVWCCAVYIGTLTK